MKNQGIYDSIKGVLNESAEQIDELSKKTLGNYVKAAHMKSADDSYWNGRDEEAERAKPFSNDDARRKYTNKETGIKRATDKLVKEDEEQPEEIELPDGVFSEAELNELSKKTLGSYVKKAASSMASSAQDAALADEWGENGEEADAHAEKRHKGIKKAVDKLVKEGAEQIEEARERTDAYRFTHHPGDPASEKKLADLKAATKGTGHRVTLKGRLGKDNPHADKYKRGGEHWTPSSLTIKKAHAKHFDVYVQHDASSKKWQDLRDEENKAYAGQVEKHRKDMTNHYKNQAHGILKKHGFELVNGGDEHKKIYAHNDLKRGSYHVATVHTGGHHHWPNTSIVSHDGKYSSHSTPVQHDAEAHAEHKLHMPAKLENTVINHIAPHHIHENVIVDGEILHEEFGLGKILEETETNLQVMFDHGIEDLELNK